MPRAVLDVNVNVSAVLSALGHPHRVADAWRAGRFVHLTSEHIIGQTLAKLRLPRIARYHRLDAEELTLVEAALRTQAVVVPVLPDDIDRVTGDPEDDAVLAAVRLGGASYLVTGDRGLLDLGAHEGATIVTPRRFLDLLESGQL
jgi:uncharacterized protein